MPQYIIYFHQQWVGDHPEEWYAGRGPLARAVVADMKQAGVLVFAGGLVEEIEEAVTADDTSGELVFTEGPYSPGSEFVGGLTIIDAPDDETARMWAGRVAEACGWPQELRRFKG
jgi:hypothetical protein